MNPLEDHPLGAIAARRPVESFAIEAEPAFFETHQGVRTPGMASVVVSRHAIAIRFVPDGELVVPAAAYGQTNGNIGANTGGWYAPQASFAGLGTQGDHLFSTHAMTIEGHLEGKVAATRLVLAGASWSGSGRLGDRSVLVTPLSVDAVNHHDKRLAITIEGELAKPELDNIVRAAGFVAGLDNEVLRVESFASDGTLLRAVHSRPLRVLGRGPHAPFSHLPDEHRLRAFLDIAQALPRLAAQGVPVTMAIEHILAHNQVGLIDTAAPLMLLATITLAYHHSHGDTVDGGSASRRAELSRINKDLRLGISDEGLERFERLRVEILDAGYFHKPGYEAGRPQMDIKFIRDIAHRLVLRLCGYSGPYYVSEQFAPGELA